MIGNVYFVGCVEASSHLIDTGDGLILIDTGYRENAETVLKSITSLGFDPKCVKIILHSHGHYDHTDATKQLLKSMPNAKTYLSFKDIKYISGFYPDFDIKDGDIIKLGNTEIECWFTPGHTEGSVSFFLNVTENGQVYRAAMFGGAGVRQLRKDFMNKWKVPYICRGFFFDSVERLLSRKVDVMLGNHTWQNHTLEKGEKVKSSIINPFIDTSEWEKFLTGLYDSLKKIIEEDSRDKFTVYISDGKDDFAAIKKSIEDGFNGVEIRIEGDAEYAIVEQIAAEFSKNVSFAFALSVDGEEKKLTGFICENGLNGNSVVISSDIGRLRRIKECVSFIRTGFITETIDENTIKKLIDIEADEVILNAETVSKEDVIRLHRKGFNVCVFGARREDTERLKDIGVDGATISID